jgi:hypothetical protein
MASIYNDIRAALETRLSNISNIPSIAYENVPFDPVVGTLAMYKVSLFLH